MFNMETLVENDTAYLSEHDGTPLYRRVAERIREDVLTGKIGVGERLLPEAKLAASFNVGLVTAQKALRILAADNLIDRGPRGTFVSPKALELLKTRNVGLMMPGLHRELTMIQSPTHFKLFDGMQKFCFENSWNLQLTHDTTYHSIRNSVRRSNLSGLILVFPRKSNYELIERLEAVGTPFVCLNIFSERIAKRVNHLNLDFSGSAAKLVEDLVSDGKRSVAITQIGKPPESAYKYQILKGYKKAVRKLGIKSNIVKLSESKNVIDEIDEYFSRDSGTIERYDAIIAPSPDEACAFRELISKNDSKEKNNISLFSVFDNERTRKAGIAALTYDMSIFGYETMVLFQQVLESESGKVKRKKIPLILDKP